MNSTPSIQQCQYCHQILLPKALHKDCFIKRMQLFSDSLSKNGKVHLQEKIHFHSNEKKPLKELVTALFMSIIVGGSTAKLSAFFSHQLEPTGYPRGARQGACVLYFAGMLAQALVKNAQNKKSQIIEAVLITTLLAGFTNAGQIKALEWKAGPCYVTVLGSMGAFSVYLIYKVARECINYFNNQKY